MNKINIIYTLLTLFVATSLNAQDNEGIEFFHGTWQEVITKAKEENKPIFVDAFTDWCGPCKRMAATTFKDAEVGELMNTKFIPYKLDMEKGEGVDFAKTNSVNAYPTLLFFDSNGNLIHKSVGSLNAEQFISASNDALDPAKQLIGLKEKYEAGNKEKTFLIQYIEALKVANEDIEAPYSDLWNLLTDEEKISEESYYSMASKTGNFKMLSGPQYDFFTLHEDSYKKLFGEKEFSNIKYSIYKAAMWQAVQFENEEEVTSAYNTVETRFPEYKGEIDDYFTLLKAYVTKDTEAQEVAMNTYLEVTNDWQMLNGKAWKAYESASKKKELNKALDYANRSVSLDANFFNLDTQGAILFKLEKYKESVNVLEAAVKSGKEMDQDTSETEKMLSNAKEKMK